MVNTTIQIERDLLDKAKTIVKKKNPLRYTEGKKIKYASAVREVLISFIEENQNLL